MARSFPKSMPNPCPRTIPSFFAGLFLVGFGLFLLLSFSTTDVALDPNTAAADCATGLLGAWAAYGILLTLGAAAGYSACLLLITWGMHLTRGGSFWASWPRVFGGLLMLPPLALSASLLSADAPLPQTGLLAHLLTPPARLYLGPLGLLILCVGIFLCGSIISFGDLVFDIISAAWHGLCRIARRLVVAMQATLAAVNLFLRPRVAALWAASTDGTLVVVNRPRSRNRTAPPPSPEPPPACASEPIEVAAAIVDDPAPSDRASAGEAVAPPAAHISPSEAEHADADDAFADDVDPITWADDDDEETAEKPVAPAPKPAPRARPRKIDAIRVHPDQENPDYQLPPLNLLDPPEAPSFAGGSNQQQRAAVLEKTLAEFKIDGRVVHIERGPRVTLYEMTLAPGIRLTRVINLADNIAMALKASNVRIIAPIPGKDTIGIEIPNLEKELVSLREVMQAVNREKRKQILPLCLAKDVSGAPILADLTGMPHLLIAGATGSGKSVCINSIILSLMMCCKPNEVKMILVDPKVVELSRFKESPHLMSPVVTDMKRAVSVLDWACQKMDERYEQLSMVHVNNIAKFNALGEAAIAERLSGVYSEDELHLFPKHLPYIVIIIDELADLMLVAGKEVEVLITRLAAKSRAVGIHVIFATQRPSVDVITGLIKANMPSRIAFQVASKVDSRTILDQNGAETLLGMGDMLYSPAGVSKLVRAQGVFVSDEELSRVVDFCKEQQAPEYHADLEGLVGGVGSKADISDFDDLFLEAGQAIIESGRGSVSLLQRRLGVGYGRASRIIDQLAACGVLGPFREGKAREILMTSEEFIGKFANGQVSLGFADGAADESSIAGLRDDEREPDIEDPFA